MFIPDPLHPAIVHFPIALLILGALGMIASLICFRDCFIRFSALVLILGAVTAYYADQTGGDAYDDFNAAFPDAEGMLNAHADRGDWTMKVAGATGILAFLLVIARMKDWESMAKWLYILTLCASIYAAYCVFDTAKYGGEMVYGDALGLSKHNFSEEAGLSSKE